MEQFCITVIKAQTPQAKGRIERQWGIFQDRLMVALRLAGANTLERAREQAEEVLKLGPQFSLENEKRLTAFKDPRIGEHRLAALRTAGPK